MDIVRSSVKARSSAWTVLIERALQPPLRGYRERTSCETERWFAGPVAGDRLVHYPLPSLAHAHGMPAASVLLECRLDSGPEPRAV